MSFQSFAGIWGNFLFQITLMDTKNLSQSRNRIRAQIVQQFCDWELGQNSRLFYGQQQQSTRPFDEALNYLATTQQVIRLQLLVTQWDSPGIHSR